METRSEFRRLSMNSSLCNARIFDDDAWEEDTETNKQQKKTKRDAMDTTIEEGEIVETQETNIKRESSPPPPTIKTEIKSEFNLSKVKKEPVDFKFDESPFNKELIKKIKLEDTPIKEEPSEDEHKKKDVRKISVKRTIFTRNSPYKRESQMGKNLDAEKRESAKVRLGPPVAKKKNEMEMDPATLARRQKQIEYGKNTIGYDNYVAKVPRDQRGLRDPKTPDKFKKYSRRAFDGLIKQWRLQLHKYDENQS